MKALTYRCRNDICMLLVFSMILSVLPFSMPQRAEASFLSTLGNAAKFLVVNGGALVAGYFGGVLGIALGGGPIGMVAGGVAGFILGKKVLNWATSNFTNAATLMGAVGGGLLVAGMGFPLLAVGVVGGALIARGIATLIKKLTNKSAPVVNTSALTLKQQEKEAEAYLAAKKADAAKEAAAAKAAATKTKAATTTATAAKASSTKVDSPQVAYDKYLVAYKQYMAATQKGDATAAKKAYSEYKLYLGMYDSLTKQK